jgi:hypothetical protein
MVLNSLGIVTVLKPSLGYKQCAEIAREGYETGKSLHDIVVKRAQADDAGKVGRDLFIRESHQRRSSSNNPSRAGHRPVFGEAT